ncbi:MAG: hypothetical protein ACREH8_02550 [Opitutaceae bacterium]
MMPESKDEHLEKLLHRTLRQLPPRRAPRSLEQRVLAEIDRRAALPWWRKNFAHWPGPARVGFVVTCAAVVTFALMGRGWITTGFDPAQFKAAFAQPFSWMENVLIVVRAITGFCQIMLRNIPPLWLYGGLVAFGSMYAALFGLGAAALKALRAHA